ncbi:hypothetical protein D3C76_1643160 [compost metagenome]
MVGIFIVTLGGIQRNTCRVLFGKARFRGLLVRVNLDGERLIGAQHLKEERQLAKTFGNLCTQQRGFIRVDDLTQGTYPVNVGNF